MSDFFVQASRIERGQIAFMIIPDHSVDDLKIGLADYGIECTQINMTKAPADEASLVEMLNDVRLRDHLLILTGKDTGHVHFNVEHCFTKVGGRALKLIEA